MTTIDLNADLGEGFGRWTLGDDAAMLDVVTSANVACGFHAGDPLALRTVLRQAADRRVAVGAHVSYRDLAGFGRRYLDASVDELTADVVYQIGALSALAAAEGTRVRYVKPHGALYTTIASGGPHAEAVVQAVVAVDPRLPVVGLAGSPFLDLARTAGLPVVAEAFADRAYAPDGSLVSRRAPGAVLHDPDVIAERAVAMVTAGAVTAVDGSSVPVAAASVCLHGDSPAAVASARAVRQALEAAGVVLAPFVGAAAT